MTSLRDSIEDVIDGGGPPLVSGTGKAEIGSNRTLGTGSSFQKTYYGLAKANSVTLHGFKHIQTVFMGRIREVRTPNVCLDPANRTAFPVLSVIFEISWHGKQGDIEMGTFNT